MLKKYGFLFLLLALLLFSNGRYSLFFAAWASAALLLYWVRNFSPVKGFLWAWLLLTIAFGFQFFGMVPVPLLFYVFVSAAYGLIGSLPFLVDLIVARNRSRFLETLIFPASWALIDFLTQFTPYGSWGNVAYSQHSQLILLQSISIFGMSYIPFLIGWFASICNWALSQKMEWAKIRKGVLAFGIVLILTIGYGSIRLTFRRPKGETVRIASVSAHRKEDQTLDPELVERFLSNQLTDEDIRTYSHEVSEQNQELINRSIREATAGAQIVFWGEANSSVLKQYEEELFDTIGRAAVDNQVFFGIGLGTINVGMERPLENKFVLFNLEGDKVIDYWKAIPIPGGEASITAAKDRIIQTTETAFGTVGAVICFDMDFPRHLRQAAGIDILLVPSNDWRSIDPWHTHMARFRAIEQGFNMVRHASNGLSIGADYTGTVISEMDHFVDDEKVLVTLSPTKGTTTLYSIIGDIFPVFCIALLILVTVKTRRDPKNQMRDN
jgi:apolipoprotein N-acyltransferase